MVKLLLTVDYRNCILHQEALCSKRLYNNFTQESKKTQLGCPNTCAEVKLFLFLFIPALEIVLHQTEFL